jgi:hypothetical protein
LERGEEEAEAMLNASAAMAAAMTSEVDANFIVVYVERRRSNDLD